MVRLACLLFLLALSVVLGVNPNGVVFLHAHKCGGTKICEYVKDLYKASPYNDNRVAPNCNLPAFGPAFHVIPWQNVTVDFVKGVMRDYRAPFFFQESPLALYEPSVFDYAVVMRHPISRIYSSMFFHAGTPRGHHTPSNLVEWGESHVYPKFNRPSPVNFGTSVVDNFFVRLLNGREVFELGPGEIKEEHLKVAMERLDNFKVVMRLERLVLDSVQLRIDFNWKKVNPLRVNRQIHPPKERPNATVTSILCERNRLDLALWKHAWDISEAKVHEKALDYVREFGKPLLPLFEDGVLFPSFHSQLSFKPSTMNFDKEKIRLQNSLMNFNNTIDKVQYGKTCIFDSVPSSMRLFWDQVGQAAIAKLYLKEFMASETFKDIKHRLKEVHGIDAIEELKREKKEQIEEEKEGKEEDKEEEEKGSLLERQWARIQDIVEKVRKMEWKNAIHNRESLKKADVCSRL